MTSLGSDLQVTVLGAAYQNKWTIPKSQDGSL